MGDSSFTTKMKIHSDSVAVQLGCVALFDTGSPLESMKRAGATSAICERHTPPRFWGRVSKSPPLQTFAAVRLSVQFFQVDQPTASLAVWAYIVPAEVKKYVVILGRDSWMRFNDRSCRTLAPRPSNNRVLGELKMSLPRLHGATAFVPDSSAHHDSFHLLYAGDAGITLFHLLYAGDAGITLSRDHRLVDVDLIRSYGTPALAGCYLVDMLHAAADFST